MIFLLIFIAFLFIPIQNGLSHLACKRFKLSFSRLLKSTKFDWYWITTAINLCLRQEEILGYLKSFARHFDLYKHIQFDQKVTTVEWNETTKLWTVKSEKGQTYVANFVVSAPGPLHKPSIPKFKGKLFRFSFMSCLYKK